MWCSAPSDVVKFAMPLKRIGLIVSTVIAVAALAYSATTATQATARADKLERELTALRADSVDSDTVAALSKRIDALDSRVGSSRAFSFDDLSGRVDDAESAIEDLRSELCDNIAVAAQRNFSSLQLNSDIRSFYPYFVRC